MKSLIYKSLFKVFMKTKQTQQKLEVELNTMKKAKNQPNSF